MSNFGAYAPLPLRLGPDTLTAPEHARICADLVAAMQSTPVAVMRVSAESGGARIVTWYSGANGTGLAHAPAIAATGGTTYGFTLTWPATYEDECEDVRRWSVREAQAGCEGSTTISEAICTVESPTSLKVLTVDSIVGAVTEVDAACTVVIWGNTTRSIADYGGAFDKCDNDTERVPYAAQYYHLLQGAGGSAMSRELSGWVHYDNLATARLFGWNQRMSEKFSCECNPGTSDRKLIEWCQVLQVDVRTTDTDEMRRRRASAAYSVLMGATVPNVDAACANLLGKWFVRCWRNWNDSMTEAPMTYWVGGTAGPVAWDIGGGTWMSEHAHLIIEVVEPTDVERGAFLTLVNEDLHRLLDRMLPAHMTWSWSTHLSTGFLLDYDHLDYAAMGA